MADRTGVLLKAVSAFDSSRLGALRDKYLSNLQCSFWRSILGTSLDACCIYNIIQDR